MSRYGDDWQERERKAAEKRQADLINDTYGDCIAMLSEAGDMAGAAMIRAVRTQWRRMVAKDGITYEENE